MLTSGDIEWIGQQLRVWETRLGWIEEATRAQVSALGDAVTALPATYQGPLPEGATGGAVDYHAAISGAPALVGSLSQTVSRYAATAESLYDSIRDAELRLVDVRAEPMDAPDRSTREAATVDELALAEITWGIVSTGYATTLANDTAILRAALTTTAVESEVPVPTGSEFAGVVAQQALLHGISLESLDPSGYVQAEADRVLAELSTDGSSLFTLLLDVAYSRRLGESDGTNSLDDVEAANRPAGLMTLLEQANEEYGFGFTEDQLSELATEFAHRSALLQANPNTAGALATGSEGPSIGDIDVDSFIAEATNVPWGEMDGAGVCVDASGRAGPLALDVGACVLSTDKDLGVIAYTAGGGGVGSPEASVSAGSIITNASSVKDLAGPAVAFSVSGGSAVGGSAIVAVGVERGPNGWRPNGIWTVQGNTALTTPSVNSSATVVNTHVVFANGTLNVIRRPVAAAANSSAAPWNWAEGIAEMGRHFRPG